MKDYLRSRRRIFCILAPGLIGLLYMILCFVNLHQSIWYDESYSAYLTHFDFAGIWKYTAADVHPPLYYFLLKTWAHFFGHTDFAMRSMSVIFGSCAIVSAFLWLKYKYGAKAAIFGSFMLAISPEFVRYGQEMRMYTLVMFLVFTGTFLLQLAIDNKQKKWWILYAVVVALGMWTHYFTALAWFTHLIYLCFVYKKKVFSKKVILTYLLAVVLFLPWIPGLISQVHAVEGGFWIGAASVETLASYWTEARLYLQATKTTNWFLILAILDCITVLAIFIKTHKKVKLLSLLAFVPLGILLLLSMPPLQPMFMPRYIIYAMLSMTLLPSVGLVLLIDELSDKHKFKKVAKRRKYAIAYGLAAAIMMISSGIGVANVYAQGNINFSTNSKPTSRELYESIAAIDSESPVIADTLGLYFDLSFYSGTFNKVYFMDEGQTYPWGAHLPLKETYFGKINDFDAFIKDKNSIIIAGKAPEDGSTIEFPREGWQVATYANLKLDDRGENYQVVLYQRENM